MSQSPQPIDYFELEQLPPDASHATTVRVFRHTAEYWGQRAHRAIAGLCINLGGCMIAAARTLHAAAAAIEQAAIARRAHTAKELTALRDAESAANILLSRVKMDDQLHACIVELTRRLASAADSLTSRSPSEQHELDEGYQEFLEERVTFRPRPPSERPPVTPLRYQVKELEATVWRIPFEVSTDDFDQAVQCYDDRATLHIDIYGKPRPLVLIDRSTNTIIRSATGSSSTQPEPPTMKTDLSVWLHEGQPLRKD